MANTNNAREYRMYLQQEVEELFGYVDQAALSLYLIP